MDPAHREALAPRHDDEIAAVLEPDLQEQDTHQVPGVDEPEHGHRRAQVRGEEDFERALGPGQVQEQRERGYEQKGQRGQQRETVRPMQRLDVEDLHEGGEYERARDQTGEVGVDDDQNRPVDLDLIGIDVA